MVSAAATMLALLITVYISLLLFSIIFIPHPQFETLVAIIQGPIFILGVVIALSLICVLISLHRLTPSKKQKE